MAHPAVESLVMPLETTVDVVDRARRARALAEIRKDELTLYWQLLGETHQPRPALWRLIANDEAYQLLILEAFATPAEQASLQA
jgi:hypothetical protein